MIGLRYLKLRRVCRLRNREQYQDFLKALNLYASEIVSKSELQQMVHDILSRYPDLMVSPQPHANRTDGPPQLCTAVLVHRLNVQQLKMTLST